jgi:predicted lipoprotein
VNARSASRRTALQAVLALLPAVVLAAACVPVASAPRADRFSAVGRHVLHDYVQPQTRALTHAATGLVAQLRDYCRAPGDARRRAQLEQQLGTTVEAWARVEFLRFGPLLEENRLENFFFWPDPRGVVQRQVRSVLAAADPGLLEVAKLRQQSAAVQGLPGLELALFADDAPVTIAGGSAAGRYRCAYAQAVAANMARLAAQIDSGWRDGTAFATELARPGPERRVYRSGTEVATEILKALSTALHAAHDQQLAPALGATIAEARGTLMPLHRSGLTSRYIAGQMRGLLDFHAASRIDAALPPGERWTAANLRAELERILEDFAALSLPAAQAVSDPQQRDLLVHAGLLLANARAIVDEYLAPALGVNLGFNSLDGD